MKLAPICLGVVRKSLTLYGWLARMSPVGMRLPSQPTRWPLYGSESVWLRMRFVSGFWKPSRFQYVYSISWVSFCL